jgi:hypothetical protein
MDLIIKGYFDKYRIKGEMPLEIAGKVDGSLFSDITVIKKWRSWKDTNLVYKDTTLNATLSGALDDCLVQDNFYMPLDYKTKGAVLIEDPRKYYQLQLNCYCLMLEASGYKTNGLSYLMYYWPKEIKENATVQFVTELIKIETNIESAKSTISEAVKMLVSGIPKASTSCEFCNFVSQRKTE